MTVPTSQLADDPISELRLSYRVELLALLRMLWERLAAQGQLARYSLLLMTTTGFGLCAPLAMPWVVARQLLLLHILAAFVLLPVTVLPFCWRHRERMMRVPSSFQKTAGRCLEWLLLTEIATGLYLFFPGNPGHLLGEFTSWAHLLLAIPFLFYAIAHGGPIHVFLKRRRLEQLREQSAKPALAIKQV